VGFSSKQKLDLHAESDIPCKPALRQAKDGFTSDVKLALLSKKKAFPNQDEQDKWKEIISAAFPASRYSHKYMYVHDPNQEMKPRLNNF